MRNADARRCLTETGDLHTPFLICLRGRGDCPGLVPRATGLDLLLAHKACKELMSVCSLQRGKESDGDERNMLDTSKNRASRTNLDSTPVGPLIITRTITIATDQGQGQSA